MTSGREELWGDDVLQSMARLEPPRDRRVALTLFGKEPRGSCKRTEQVGTVGREMVLGLYQEREICVHDNRIDLLGGKFRRGRYLSKRSVARDEAASQ